MHPEWFENFPASHAQNKHALQEEGHMYVLEQNNSISFVLWVWVY